MENMKKKDQLIRSRIEERDKARRIAVEERRMEELQKVEKRKSAKTRPKRYYIIGVQIVLENQIHTFNCFQCNSVLPVNKLRVITLTTER